VFRKPRIRSTTILAVRRGENVVLAGDGQVTLDTAMVKGKARKVRSVADGAVLVGFAGGAADGFALLDRFEQALAAYQNQLERAAVELVREWRTDRVLRRQTFLLSGTGDLIEPDDEVMGVGSGSVAAIAAARALVAHTALAPREIAVEALKIAAGIDIYTNAELTVEEL
jgi:ATP-dependent HslUV protease subunit HslV